MTLWAQASEGGAGTAILGSGEDPGSMPGAGTKQGTVSPISGVSAGRARQGWGPASAEARAERVKVGPQPYRPQLVPLTRSGSSVVEPSL